MSVVLLLSLSLSSNILLPFDQNTQSPSLTCLALCSLLEGSLPAFLPLSLFSPSFSFTPMPSHPLPPPPCYPPRAPVPSQPLPAVITSMDSLPGNTSQAVPPSIDSGSSYAFRPSPRLTTFSLTATTYAACLCQGRYSIKSIIIIRCY